MRNTLKLLLELGHPLKKPASETTNFELLVLAFRVFEFQRSKVENSEEVRSSSVQVAKLKIPRAKRLGLVVGKGAQLDDQSQ